MVKFYKERNDSLDQWEFLCVDEEKELTSSFASKSINSFEAEALVRWMNNSVA